MRVAKFGGTSMADAMQIRKVAFITTVKGDDYKVVVVSAPGKRFKGDTKMTDLLYEFAKDRTKYLPILERLEEIESQLGISHKASGHFLAHRNNFKTLDDIISRGEYYAAMIFSEYTGRIFLDAAMMIMIDGDGKATDVSYQNIANATKDDAKYVIPGFYGCSTSGGVKTFSRGGSDITGSIVARAIKADVYENWTDVSGVFASDPNIIPDAKKIDEMTYRELLLLGENGAQVFHPMAVEPVENLIPINIRNTNRPNDKGTMIKEKRDYSLCPIIAVTEKDGVVTVIGEGKIIEQKKGADLKAMYKKYIDGNN